jgi:hypothetical protein
VTKENPNPNPNRLCPSQGGPDEARDRVAAVMGLGADAPPEHPQKKFGFMLNKQQIAIVAGVASLTGTAAFVLYMPKMFAMKPQEFPSNLQEGQRVGQTSSSSMWGNMNKGIKGQREL